MSSAPATLKFDHPGLDATATRSGSRLVIQNDIGATDAHVVVIAVEDCTVRITYTDVHLVRSKFFAGLFDEFPVVWSGLDRHRAEGLGAEGVFYLVTGRYEAKNTDDRGHFLEAIGAALVFLIDWNKARKVLRSWVSNADAVRILDWAARNRIGHRAFLELGGGELVALAVRNAAPSRIGFGEKLNTALGRDPAVDFLKAVLRISTNALLEGCSVRSRVTASKPIWSATWSAPTARCWRSWCDRRASHATRVMLIAHHLAGLRSGRQVDGDGLAARARRIEEKADKIAIDARSEVARFGSGPTIEQLVNRAEEAIDELEHAAFIASLLPAASSPRWRRWPSFAPPSAREPRRRRPGSMRRWRCRRASAPTPRRRWPRLAVSSLEHTADARERAVTTLVLRGDLGLTASLWY